MSSFLLIFYENFTFHLLLPLVFLVRLLVILLFLFFNFFLFCLFLRIAFHDILHVFYFLLVDTSCQDGDPYVCPWWSVADRNRWKCSYAWRQGWTQYSLASEQWSRWYRKCSRKMYIFRKLRNVPTAWDQGINYYFKIEISEGIGLFCFTSFYDWSTKLAPLTYAWSGWVFFPFGPFYLLTAHDISVSSDFPFLTLVIEKNFANVDKHWKKGLFFNSWETTTWRSECVQWRQHLSKSLGAHQQLEQLI